MSYDSINVSIPAGSITFSPDNNTVPSSTYVNGSWSTTVYACETSVVFLSGSLYTLTAPITAGSPATDQNVRLDLAIFGRVILT